MSLTSTLSDGVKVITVADSRIDAAMAIQFKEDMRVETAGGPDRIILDLSSVDFVDSSGLGAIVASLKQMGAGRRLDLAGLTPTVDKVFQLTRMDTVFKLFPSLDKALTSISR